MRYEVNKIVSGAISCFAKLLPDLKIPEGEAFCNIFGITQEELDGKSVWHSGVIAF